MRDYRRFICLIADVDSLEAAQAQIFTPEFKSLFPKDMIEILAEHECCDIENIWEYEGTNPDHNVEEFVEAYMEFAKAEREQREGGDLP